MSTTTGSHDVFVRFNYLKWQDIYLTTRPYSKALALSTSDKQLPSNLVFERGNEQKVHDVRGLEHMFTLDSNGFVYRTQQSQLVPEDFTDAAKIEKVFLPECEAFLKKQVEGVDQVVFFDWRVRRSGATGPGKLEGAQVGGLLVPPADFVHNDQTESSAMRRVHASFPTSEVDFLLQGRVQMLNIWRPINGPVEDRPLAVCDGARVDPSKLLEADIIREKYTGKMMYALYDANMHWHYMSRQRDEEMLLFKSYDSKDGVVKYVPHSSFTLPNIQPGTPSRQSIEVRALVFTHPKNPHPKNSNEFNTL